MLSYRLCSGVCRAPWTVVDAVEEVTDIGRVLVAS